MCVYSKLEGEQRCQQEVNMSECDSFRKWEFTLSKLAVPLMHTVSGQSSVRLLCNHQFQKPGDKSEDKSTKRLVVNGNFGLTQSKLDVTLIGIKKR